MISDQSATTVLSVLIAQLVASAGMVGVIWFVQLITYPQFAILDEDTFVDYHAEYSKRVTWIVAPLMLIEIASAFLVVFQLWKSPFFGLAALSLLVVLTLWALTAFVQVPQHSRLSYGYSKETIEALVRGNWVRTVLWTVKVVLSSILLYRFVTNQSGV